MLETMGCNRDSWSFLTILILSILRFFIKPPGLAKQPGRRTSKWIKPTKSINCWHITRRPWCNKIAILHGNRILPTIPNPYFRKLPGMPFTKWRKTVKYATHKKFKSQPPHLTKKLVCKAYKVISLIRIGGTIGIFYQEASLLYYIFF